MRWRQAIYGYSGDFGGASECFKKASGLTWAELACQLGTLAGFRLQSLQRHCKLESSQYSPRRPTNGSDIANHL